MDAWYKQLGYYENPFLLNPFKDDTPLLGQEEQLNDALYYLKAGSIVFVEASEGAGKTKFLRELIKSFRGQVIYVNAARLTKNLDIEDLLRRRNGLSGKLFGSKPKGMILFLDNIDELSRVNLERLKFYYDQEFLHSIIASGTSMKNAGFPESFRQRMRKISLSPLTADEAVSLALKRLDEENEEIEPLIKPAQLKRVWTAAHKNPKTYLMLLHQVFEDMYLADDAKITAEHLKAIDETLGADERKKLQEQLKDDTASYEEQYVDHGSELMKIGEYYRNPDAEMFCGNCGAIVQEDHKRCPECQASFEEVEIKETKQGEANA